MVKTLMVSLELATNSTMGTFCTQASMAYMSASFISMSTLPFSLVYHGVAALQDCWIPKATCVTSPFVFMSVRKKTMANSSVF